MDNDWLREWLSSQGCDADLVKAIVDSTDFVEQLYAGDVRVGAAIPHSVWLDDLANSGAEASQDRIAWFLLGVIAAMRAMLESTD